MKHTLHLLGWTGNKTAYLDLPLEEALRRYHEKEKTTGAEDYGCSGIPTKSFEFDDEFGCYDAWFWPVVR